MKSRNIIQGLAVAAIVLASAQAANATFVLNPGAIGIGDNVIIQACTGNSVGPAALVQGCLNTSHTTLLDVSTTGGGNLLANGGQARFDASGGNIGNFSVAFDNPSLGFSVLVFNINAANGTNSKLTFTIAPFDKNGNAEAPQSFSNTLSGNGQNFFTLISTDGEVARSISVLSSLSNILDMAQIRVTEADVPGGGGGGPGPNVPEPATLFLLGSALLSYAEMRRRKQRP